MASVGDNLTFIDGTCIEWIRSRKHRRDNTSGFRGVYKHGNKWRVSIGFKGKHYHIGTFDEFAEAQKARLAAEKVLHVDFITAWDDWSIIAQENPDWAENNPFVFDVHKESGKFVISTYAINNHPKARTGSINE